MTTRVSQKVPIYSKSIDMSDVNFFFSFFFGRWAGSELVKINSFPIISWDMDSTATYTIDISTPTGSINIQRIIGTNAMINSDAGLRYDSNSIYNGIQKIELSPSSSNIVITRLAGGFFDSADFNDASVTRGELILAYIA